MSKRVIVTGSSGYIGGQTAIHLKDQGYSVIGIDTRVPPQHLKPYLDRSYQEDFSSKFIRGVINDAKPKAIIHCAGTSLVGPSMRDPAKYYHNNFVKTKTLLDNLRQDNIKTRLIFSSSAAVYGEPVMTPCSEEDPPLPISPYGESKFMVEQMLQSYHRAYGLDYVALRYFNACGADPQCRHGQESSATHIIARVLESLRDGRKFTLNGDGYPTPDGTCVRDYVHVMDIARAHELAINPEVDAGIYNLGTNTGASNRDIIEVAQQITKKLLELEIGSIREGDPAILTASSDRFHNASGWQPQYSLHDIVQHAWNWYRR